MIVQYLRNAYLTPPTDGADGRPDPLIPTLSPYLTSNTTHDELARR